MNLVQIKIIIELRKKGVSLQKIGRSIERLRLISTVPETPLVDLRIFTSGKSIFVSQEGKIWNASTGQFLLFDFSFKNIFDEAGEYLRKPKGYTKLTLKDIYPRDEIELQTVA